MGKFEKNIFGLKSLLHAVGRQNFRKALFLEQGMIGDDKDFFREGLREVAGH